MNCLICQETLLTRPSFRQLFSLHEQHGTICPTCRESFEEIGDSHCPRCFKKGDSAICSDCHRWEDEGYSVNHFSLYSYNEAMKSFFKTYKFSGDYLLRTIFAKEIKQALKPYEKTHQIIPVPLSQERLQARGFNQVTGLLDAAGVTYSDILTKEHTIKQSHKNRQERLSASQTFQLLDKSLLNEKIMIVDDVYTTGATIQLVKKILKANGVKELTSFSLAR